MVSIARTQKRSQLDNVRAGSATASRTIQRRAGPKKRTRGLVAAPSPMRGLLPETETRGIDDIDAFLIGQEARIDSPIVRFDAPSVKGEAQTHTGAIRHFVVDGQYGEPYPTSIRFQCRGWREFSNELGYEELLPIVDLLIEPHFRD